LVFNGGKARISAKGAEDGKEISCEN